MMNEIIKRAVEKYNEKQNKWYIELQPDFTRNSFYYSVHKKQKENVNYSHLQPYQSCCFETLIIGYAFLQTLVDDEMVCSRCGERRIINVDHPVLGKISKCRFCNETIDFFIPKHELVAERLFRLLYRGEEEEAIKLLSTFI